LVPWAPSPLDSRREFGRVRVRGAEQADHDHGLERGQLPGDLGHHAGSRVVLTVVGVAVHGQQHGGLDLREPVHHAAGAEIGRARGPDRADAGGGEQPDHRLGDVRQQRHDAIALGHAQGPQPARDPGHFGGELGVAELGGAAAF
jgi:hypothetical protein